MASKKVDYESEGPWQTSGHCLAHPTLGRRIARIIPYRQDIFIMSFDRALQMIELSEADTAKMLRNWPADDKCEHIAVSDQKSSELGITCTINWHEPLSTGKSITFEYKFGKDRLKCNLNCELVFTFKSEELNFKLTLSKVTLYAETMLTTSAKTEVL